MLEFLLCFTILLQVVDVLDLVMSIITISLTSNRISKEYVNTRFLGPRRNFHTKSVNGTLKSKMNEEEQKPRFPTQKWRMLQYVVKKLES